MSATLQALRAANTAWADAVRAKAPDEVLAALDEARVAAASAHAMFLASTL